MNLEEFNYDNFLLNIKYKQYKKIVNKFEKYITIQNVGITPYLIDKYIEALINVNRSYDAYKNLKVLIKHFPKYYDYRKLGELFIKCGALTDLFELCKENNNINDLYFYAKTCLYWKHLEEAKYLFYKFILETDDNIKIKYSVRYIDIINKSMNEDIFLPVSYEYFKINGGQLEPGYIIYAYKSSRFNFSNENYKLTYKDPKPYLIWKIVGNSIHAFPITKNIYNNLTYVIPKEKYSSFLFDKRVKDELTIIDKKDVEKITEKISQDDLAKSLKSVHQLISINQNKDNKIFINERVKEFNISKGDIIQLFDKELNIFKLFYIVDTTDDKKYKCLKLSDSKNDYRIIDDKYVYINKDDFIMECYKINQEKIDSIERQIYKKKIN